MVQEDKAASATGKMKLSDKIALEHRRQTMDDWRTIYLHREGTFFRAFDCSAWLLSTYVYSEDFRKQIGAKSPLMVQHVASKGSGDYLFAGFPIASVEKYVTMCELRQDGDVVLAVMHDMLLPAFHTPEEYERAYSDYLASLPAAKERKADRKKDVAAEDGFDVTDGSGIMACGALTEILRAVLAWPIEEKTPLDTVNEFRRIKRIALRMI